MSEWRMTDEQYGKIVGREGARGAREGVEAAVRLGIVVPAQDGEERLRALIAAVEGAAKECLGYADTSFIGNVPMGVKHVANRILGVLEKGPPKPEDCFTKACRAVVTYHHASCPLAALETRPREESPE